MCLYVWVFTCVGVYMFVFVFFILEERRRRESKLFRVSVTGNIHTNFIPLTQVISEERRGRESELFIVSVTGSKYTNYIALIYIYIYTHQLPERSWRYP